MPHARNMYKKESCTAAWPMLTDFWFFLHRIQTAFDESLTRRWDRLFISVDFIAKGKRSLVAAHILHATQAHNCNSIKSSHMSSETPSNILTLSFAGGEAGNISIAVVLCLSLSLSLTLIATRIRI